MLDLVPVDDNPGGLLPWAYEFEQHFIGVFEDVKNEGLDFISLDKKRLHEGVVRQYAHNYNELKSGIVSQKPDRHKIISLATKAFLDAAPFSSDYAALEKMDASMQFWFLHPNEYFAIDICAMVLDRSAQFRSFPVYEFKFPDKVYVDNHEQQISTYEDELFSLYRHYINRRRKRLGQFSIHQMAHLYFLLEMGCDIAHYNRRDDYYLKY